MKPTIEITTDELDRTIVEISLLGARLDTFILSKAVMDALRDHFAAEKANA